LPVRAPQTTPLLATKLFVPRANQALVPRPHLVQRLEAGLHRKLTLVSAPAGYGKSTLLSAWAATGTRKTAWLALDEGDRDPVRFLRYVVAALQVLWPSMGVGVLSALQSTRPMPLEAMLTALLNDMNAVPEQFVFVLDDYHLVDAEPVDHALAFLLEHLPAQLHLVIATRQDPPIPLARLRARGQLTELRASDLCFAAAEVTTYLNQVMGLSLSPRDIVALDERTEGWIAGLQLAALSLQGRRDVPGFIRSFAGDHRYIADYLIDEVLQRQPASVRDFLLQTCILDRLCGPLCDAVTGREDSSARLHSLAGGNVLVVPLDDHRRWYRYHHLFADVLLSYLRAEQPEQVAILHRRASAWHEQQELLADAIRHALAAGDFERSADLIERTLADQRQDRHEVTLLGWLMALPDEVVRRRPVLSVRYAWALLERGEVDAAEARLRDAEQWLTTPIGDPDLHGRPAQPLDGTLVMYDEESRRLAASIAVCRAGYALALGDLTATVTYARRALDLAPAADHLRRGAAEALQGLAAWSSGDLETAQQFYSAGMALMQRAGYLAGTVGCAMVLADIRIVQGRLHDALRIYEQALRIATAQGEPVSCGTADLYVGLCKLHRERGDLVAATWDLERSTELGENARLPQNRYRSQVAMARMQEVRGNLNGALDLLLEAERLYVNSFFPNVRPVQALRARVWIAQGRLDDAVDWAREQGLSADDQLSYRREFEHITLARVLLALATRDHTRHSLYEAMKLLERLRQAAHAGGRMGRVIEILVLQALAHQADGDMPSALVSLEHALMLAEPEGYVRVFVDEGPPMATLVAAAAKQGIAPHYTHKLLSAFGPVGDEPFARVDVIEPLSERELDVLRLLGTDLDGPDIARELTMSLNTMRTHTKNIYSKLGVNNRRAAVRRAAELALLARARSHEL
jgi:LuxR family transcriptional regulator, maltose regulon positive regulatory protein